MPSVPAPSVVVPGNHDGVHLGHRALLDAAGARAANGPLRTVAMFFDPHPTRVLAPERAAPLLTSVERRKELLLALGADDVVVQPFDRGLASMSPEDFVRAVLVEALGARAVVVGPDFRFGKGRAGDVEALRTIGLGHDMDVTVVAPVTLEGERVSSTTVRAHLAKGDVHGAARLLGRAHDVRGTVVRGDQRGRTIGFPTANLACEDVVLPQDGVYAVVARRLDGSGRALGEPIAGVANLGVRPTFAAGRSVEAHLFDFDADLYGEDLRVAFVARVRGERRFDGIEALRAQIANDARDARAAIAASDRELLRWL
jgi:riboflavin kinase/FMN adenylyltransferase